MNREGSILVFVVIILVLLFLGAVFVIYDMSGQMDRLEQDLVNKDTKIGELEASYGQVRTESNEAFNVVQRGASSIQPALVQDTHFKSAYMAIDWFKTNPFWKSLATTTEGGPEGTGFSNDVGEVEKLTQESADQYKEKDAISTIAALRHQLVVAVGLLPTFEQKYRSAEAKVVQNQEEFNRDLKQLRERIDRLEIEKKGMETDLTEKITKRNQTITKLEQDLQVERDAYKELNKKHNDEISHLEADISKLTQRIEEIGKLRERTAAETEADGQITIASQRSGLAWIDLGAKHGLRRGLIFEVFQYGKGGREQVKGRVEVRKVGEDLSEVAILDSLYIENPQTGELRPHDDDLAVPTDWTGLRLPLMTNPIVKGDLVRNAFFKPNETQRFVIIGSRTTNPYYGYNELKLKIQESGGEVQEEVTIETDFAVILEDAQTGDFKRQFETADQFGVVIMRESDLLRYLSKK